MQLQAFTLAGFAPGTFSESAVESGGSTGWLPVTVPQDVHTALLSHGLIPDPRYYTNDIRTAWVEDFTWVYRTSFPLSPKPGAVYRLVCEGLDTYCTIYVNGQYAGETANMLVSHTLDVTSFVQDGDNQLTFVFDPMPERAAKPLPEGFWINYSTERAWARKAAFGYGWDWCARLATVGIWRPVTLEELTDPVLKDIFFATETASAGYAEVVCTALTEDSVSLTATFSLRDGTREYSATVPVKDGRCQARLRIDAPRLWWTWDLGEPFLYTARTALYRNGTLLYEKEFPYGVRTVALRLKDENSGEDRFQFLLNGVPVYGRGANWVPVDNLLTLPNRKDRTESLLHLARESHMNMLCLWGGGIYEDDLFYENCDALGILVWQYFMFACGEYPDFDEDFTEAVRAEVHKAVVRLRNHPCIALWVGNVESQMLCDKIGLDRPMYGARLFEKDIAAWTRSLDPTRPYWPSSPYGGESPNSPSAGDRHNWDVWFGDIPYTGYRRDNCRFASEFGIHAAPAMETAARWLPPEELRLGSFGWSYINKDAEGPSHMEALLHHHTGAPATLEEAEQYSMLTQADALRCAAEHYRRHMPRNNGALIWQLNDSWPCHSWSIVDYDGIPKAAWYAARKFFAPVSLLLYPRNDDETEICISNTTRTRFSGTVRIAVHSVMGECIHSETIRAEVSPYACQCVKTLRVGGRFAPNVILPNRKRWYYVSASVWELPLSETFRFFCEYKDAALPRCILACEQGSDGKGLRVTLKSACFAKMVSIEGDMRGLHLSDNYFDMNADTPYTVTVCALTGAPPAMRRLYVRALNSPSPIPLFDERNT